MRMKLMLKLRLKFRLSTVYIIKDIIGELYQSLKKVTLYENEADVEAETEV